MYSTSWLEKKANFYSGCKKNPRGFLVVWLGKKKIHPKPLKAIAKYLWTEHTVDFRYHSWVKLPSASVQQYQHLCFIYITFFEVNFGLLLHSEHETQDWPLRWTTSNCSPAGAMPLAYLSATSSLLQLECGGRLCWRPGLLQAQPCQPVKVGITFPPCLGYSSMQWRPWSQINCQKTNKQTKTSQQNKTKQNKQHGKRN